MRTLVEAIPLCVKKRIYSLIEPLRRPAHYMLAGHIFRRIKIPILRKKRQSILQIGGGPHSIPEWINGDIIHGDIYLNAAKKFPFPDKSLNGIFAEQFIEHIPYNCGEKFLRECYRVLKSDGVLRLATPDLGFLIQMHNEKNITSLSKSAIDRHNKIHNPNCKTRTQYINDIFHCWGHEFIYDYNTIEHSSKKAGFSIVERVQFGISSYAPFKNRERHASKEYDNLKDPVNLIVEARKQ